MSAAASSSSAAVAPVVPAAAALPDWLAGCMSLRDGSLSLSDSHPRTEEQTQELTRMIRENTLETVRWISIPNEESEARPLLAALRSNTHIQAIQLREPSAVTLQLLASALQHNQYISRLELRGDIKLARIEMSAAWARALGAALQVNRTLTELDISAYEAGGGFSRARPNEIGDAGVQDIAAALAINSSIRKLCLSGIGMGPEGMRHLAAALQQNRSVTSLDLSGNQCGDDAVQALAAALRGYPSLTQIDLRVVGMTAVSMQALRVALQDNSAITDLSVGEWMGDLSSEVSLLIAESTTLERLQLLGMKDVTAIAAALQYNRCIHSLVLDSLGRRTDRQHNSIVPAFMEALQSNTSLTHLKMRGVNAPPTLALFPFLQRNRQLQSNPATLTSAISRLPMPQRNEPAAQRLQTQLQQQCADNLKLRQHLQSAEAKCQALDAQLEQQHAKNLQLEQHLQRVELDRHRLLCECDEQTQIIQNQAEALRRLPSQAPNRRASAPVVPASSSPAADHRLEQVNESSAEFDRVCHKFHASLAHMPAYKGLSFRITAVQRIHNPRLTETFYSSMRYFYEQNYRSDEPIRSVYHGTHPDNIGHIVAHNLSLEKKGQTDQGWFGGGLYFSRHADYVMVYSTTGQYKLAQAGDKGKLLQFDILPGRMYKMEKVRVGVERQELYDSHVSPTEFEHVLFDPRHVLPRYVLSFDILQGAGAVFEGSPEHLGPNHHP